MYNSFAALPSIPYAIMKYLATSKNEAAENLWKLLKYNDYNALQHENLSFTEKMNLVWRTGRQEQFNVFLTPLIEDAICESQTIMKCYQYYIHASELYNGSVVYAFDCLYGGNMALVEYDGIPVSRGDLFIHCIMDTLNGATVGGVGKLTFLDNLSRYSSAKSVVGNQRTFTGVCVYLSTLVGDAGRSDDCGA